jgi:hypothetical protein
MLRVPSRATLCPQKSESINFKSSKNIFIEGENLEVLKLLYRPYEKQIKMIYIIMPHRATPKLAAFLLLYLLLRGYYRKRHRTGRITMNRQEKRLRKQHPTAASTK